MKLEEVFWKGVMQPRGGVEGKWEIRAERGAKPNQPDFLFTIEEFSVETGEMVSRVIAHARADAPVWNYIQKHAVFSREPRPFFLHWIYDAFWKLKLALADFGEPQRFTVTLAMSGGGRIIVDVSAEVFYQGGGQAMVHLTNYANGHVTAALREILESKPDAVPTGWAGFVKGKLYAERKEAAVRERVAQERRLGSRPGGSGLRWLFVDESGDLGLDDDSHHYITCGVGVDDQHVPKLRAEIRQILQMFWKGGAPQEIHFSHLPGSKFEGVTDALAECFIRYVGQCVCFAGDNITFFLHLLRGEAEFNRAEDVPIKTNLADLIADKDAHPRRKLLMFLMEEMAVHVGLECLRLGKDLSIVHDRKNKGWMNLALEKGAARSKDSIEAVSGEIFGQRLSPASSFAVSASEAEPCLWLSDWIAWELGSLVRGGELSRAFRKVLEKVDFVTFGDLGDKTLFAYPGGPMKQRYPDWPREIASML